MSQALPMQACPSCKLQFTSQKSVDQHTATQHAVDREAMDSPGYWDAMQPGDPRRSVRRKYKVVRPDYDSMTYIEVTDDD